MYNEWLWFTIKTYGLIYIKIHNFTTYVDFFYIIFFLWCIPCGEHNKEIVTKKKSSRSTHTKKHQNATEFDGQLILHAFQKFIILKFNTLCNNFVNESLIYLYIFFL